MSYERGSLPYLTVIASSDFSGRGNRNRPCKLYQLYKLYKLYELNKPDFDLTPENQASCC